jgi:hypothetical protein
MPTLKDLKRTDGAKNMGGIRNVGAIALIADTLLFPTVPAEITDFDTAAVISGNITFKAGKSFKEIYCTTGKGSVSSEQVGESDCRSWKNKCKIFFPGSQADALGAAAAYANSHIVVVVTENSAPGRKRIVGSKENPAEIVMSSITSAETSDGVKGWTFEVEAAAETPAPIYSGVITFTEAE